ncbi:hypothetical protein ElyMa_006460700, partial [Elysia marginata]
VESDIRDENTNKSNKENTTVEEEDEESADDTGVNIPVDQNESNLSEKKTNQPETESEVSAQTVQKEASDLHLETSSTPVVPSEEFANEKTASTTVEVTGKHKKKRILDEKDKEPRSKKKPKTTEPETGVRLLGIQWNK